MSQPKIERSLGQKVFRVLSGFEIAVVCFILLFLLTFFGTWEQQYLGLYQAIDKYFDIDSLFVVPRNEHDKIIFLPLPGTYWVIVVLSINMFCGGIVRMRKGWRTAAVLVSHFAILFMLVAGAVSSIAKKEGLMMVYQGEKSDYAQSYHSSDIEVFAYDEKGDRTAPTVISSGELEPLRNEDTLHVDLPEFPFELEVTGYLGASSMALAKNDPERAKDHKVIDGYFIHEVERSTTQEENMPGCYVTVSKGDEVYELMLSNLNPQPISFVIDGTRYGMLLTRKIWPMPFEVELNKTVGDYYPGTRKARWFQSDVTKVTDGNREDYEIIMNHPMRHGGFTLYQARWDKPQGRPFSGFAIVSNPSDRWPEWAFYVSTAALFTHFLTMLSLYIMRSTRKSSKAVS